MARPPSPRNCTRWPLAYCSGKPRRRQTCTTGHNVIDALIVGTHYHHNSSLYPTDGLNEGLGLELSRSSADRELYTLH